MTLSGTRLAYLAALIRMRLRGGVMSLGIAFALIVAPIVVLIELFALSRGSAGGVWRNVVAGGLPFWRERGYTYVNWMQIMLLIWMPVTAGLACGRERDSGRLAVLGSSRVGGPQMVLGLLFGPAIIEWVWAALLGAAMLLLRREMHGDMFDLLRNQSGRFLGVLVGCLFAVNLQLPRPAPFKAHRIVVSLGWLWIGGLTYWTVRPFVSGLFSWPFGPATMAFLGALLGSQAMALVKGRGPGWFLILLRLAAAPALVALYSSISFVDAGNRASQVILPLSLAMIAGATIFWDAQVYSQVRWRPAGTFAAAAASLLAALLLAVLVDQPSVLTLPRDLLAATVLLALATIARLVLYLTVLAWVARRMRTWQAIALVVLCVAPEILPLFGGKTIGLAPVGGFLCRTFSVTFAWREAFAPLYPVAVASNGPSNLPFDVPFEVLAAAMRRGALPSFWPNVLIIGLALLAATGEILARRRLARATMSPAGGRDVSASAGAASGGPDLSAGNGGRIRPLSAVLGQISPLWAVMAIESIRRTSFIALLPKIAEVIVVAYLVIRVAGDAATGVQVSAPAYLDEWALWTVIWQGIFGLPAVLALYTTLRRERRDGRLRQYALSGMSRPRVAWGYLVGAGFGHLLVMLALSIAYLGFMTAAGQLQRAVYVQSCLWGSYFLVASAVAAYECQPFGEPGRWVIPGWFMASMVICIQIVLVFVPDDLGWKSGAGSGANAPASARQSPHLSWNGEMGWSASALAACAAVLVAAAGFALVVRRLRLVERKPVRAIWLLILPAGAALLTTFGPDRQAGAFARATITGFAIAVLMVYRASSGLYPAIDLGVGQDDGQGATGAAAQAPRWSRLCLYASITAAVALALTAIRPGVPPGRIALLGTAIAAALALRLFFYAKLFLFLRLRFPEARFVLGVGVYFAIEMILPSLLLVLVGLTANHAWGYGKAGAETMAFTVLGTPPCVIALASFLTDAGNAFASFPPTFLGKPFDPAGSTAIQSVLFAVVMAPHLLISVAGWALLWRRSRRTHGLRKEHT